MNFAILVLFIKMDYVVVFILTTQLHKYIILLSAFALIKKMFMMNFPIEVRNINKIYYCTTI